MITLRSDKVLVLGGGSGIGKAIARRLIDAGARVTIVGRSGNRLKAAAEEIGSPALFYKVGDVSDTDAHMDLFCECEQLMGGLNAFVNAALVDTRSVCGEERYWEPFDITGEEWDALCATNFKGAYFLMRNQVEYLKSRGRKGNILNFSSNAACMDITGLYGAAKLSISRWTRSFGKRYARDGIIINAIAPGITLTGLVDNFAKSTDQFFPRHALGRFIRPEEIAELSFYLMSNYGEIICGSTVVADAGDEAATF